jgi:hypothetical protein
VSCDFLGSKVVMDFQIIIEAVVSNQFLNVKICQTILFFIFPHTAVMPKDFYPCLTNCIGVFRETDSVTHKKGTGRPIHANRSFRRDRHTK